jgi:hypothetical protein
MRNRRLVRASGLSIFGALSLMAFTAVVAQAGIFKINGTPAAQLLAKIQGAQETPVSILVPGRNLKVECTGVAILNDSAIENNTDGLAKKNFTNCVARNHKTGALLPCTVSIGEVLTLFLPILHTALNPYILFEGDPIGEEKEKKEIGSGHLLGEFCPLPEANAIAGAAVARVDNNNTLQPLLLFTQQIQELIGDQLLFGGFPAFIIGNITIEGVGNHLNKTIGIG